MRFALGANEQSLFARLREVMPPGARPCPPDAAEHTILLLLADDGYRIEVPENGGMRCRDLEFAVGLLDAQVRQLLAMHAPGRFFVEAGVVAVDGRAIVMPGPSMTGKSSLVAALVDRGASYYSDTFAIFDGEGLVYPFARPIPSRGEHQPGLCGEEPLPVGVVVRVPYRSDGEWQTGPRTRGEGLLLLMEHAVAARERPVETVRALRRVSEHALFLDGHRVDAAEAAANILKVAMFAGSN